MLQPSDFKVNEAWIAFRVNDRLIHVKDQPYDIYIMMDAASTYVFGHILSRTVDEAPDAKEVKKLFREAWSAKRRWAKRLIFPEGSMAEDVFRRQAEESGLTFTVVPLSELHPIIAPVKELFSRHF